MPRALSVNLDPMLCLLLPSAPANGCFLLHLLGVQAWHRKVCLGMLRVSGCKSVLTHACVYVDSVVTVHRSKNSSCMWALVFSTHTLPTRFEIRLSFLRTFAVLSQQKNQ